MLPSLKDGFDDVSVTIMYPRDVVADTYAPVYDPSVKVPDFKTWNSTMLTGMQ